MLAYRQAPKAPPVPWAVMPKRRHKQAFRRARRKTCCPEDQHFKMVNIHDQTYFANAIYHGAGWCLKLLGKGFIADILKFHKMSVHSEQSSS
jgi:hypothetical protein